MDLDMTKLLGIEGIDLTQLPAQIKQLENFINLGKSQLPKLVDFLNAKYIPAKGNVIVTVIVPTNTKVFIYVKELSLIENKEVLIKTHYKGELLEIIEKLKEFLPAQND